ASRWLMKNAARMVDFRSYRDAASKAYLASIGLAVDGDAVFPDLAFRLATPPRPIRPQGARITVGVGVMAYSGWKRDAPDGGAIHGAYLDKLAGFIRRLEGQGHDVVLVTGDAEDAVAVEEMMERLRGEGASCVTCRPTPTLQALM